MGTRRTAQEDAMLQDKRTKLQERIDEFCRKSNQYLPVMQDNPFIPPDLSEEWVTFDDSEPVNDDLPSFDEDEDGEGDAGEQDEGLPARSTAREEESIFIDNALPAEEQRIPLPSTFGRTACAGRLKHLAKVELSLRKGQANDALHALRMAIGQKSFVYRSKIRKGSTSSNSNYKQRLRNSSGAQTLEMSIDQSSKVYISARRAIMKLGASKADKAKYQVLQPEHVHASTAVVDFNARGQRNESLSWIWHVHRAPAEDPTWMQECKRLLFTYRVRTHLTLSSIQSELASCQIQAGPMGGRIGVAKVGAAVDQALS